MTLGVRLPNLRRSGTVTSLAPLKALSAAIRSRNADNLDPIDMRHFLTVKAEAEMLRILIDNLIDNAIKYGRNNGRVEVRMRRARASACLTVRDDGPGVSVEDRARLTDRFFREAGNGESGSGLGLSIVARIAVCFGAKLYFAEGIEGSGLGVVVEFPLA
ncbi:sensor histidine kinase [Trinickia mobilis]|uniref:sensor histidine kinase n=1 Tax=Trinickia mobilis TaxID=2816356 RepID=UPI001A8C4917|nr:ATP-binding protein [Trinickia mobilis]